MRILKIAIYTLLIGLGIIFAFGLVRESILSKNPNGIADILFLIPPVVGLYFIVSGTIESIKEKSFKMKIVYGIVLGILGMYLWGYMGTNVFQYLRIGG